MLDKVKQNTRSVEELARLRAKLDYWSKKVSLKRPVDIVLVFSTDLMTELTVQSPDDAREGEAVRIPVYRVGSMAKMIGKSVQTVRLWERDGILPDSGVYLVGRKRGDRAPQRCYTYAQMRVVYDMYPLLEFGDYRGNEYTVFSREVWRRWLMMPDGVFPETRGDQVGDELPTLARPAEAHMMRGKKRRARV